MLDLARLERVKLRRTPWGQLFVAQLLRIDYAFPRLEVTLARDLKSREG